ncbi:phenylacetate--CoA ligase family protein [Nitrosococcus wardiae]|uniref:Phenylacetate--CoA ligase family protein n=1 Tax=Nitrosococcus wardiae TaxID=1814290 RepID=A0A4P7C138_9GAMM|nr:phenylacetate--CoA ligase family protein [Nitrosococcus wardiae]QBQ54486.1 phenylacetate--CoA ligase family protein [Nitrosococcus wardiae]
MHPYLSRHLLYPLHESLVKRPTFKYLAELEQSQWLSRPEIERLQGTKLKALLRVAYDHCPWHRKRIQEAGLELDGETPLTLQDLRRLPTMNKQDALENRDEMTWQGVPGGAFKYNTGGSSGEPLIFYFGRWRQASDAAGRMRARRWWGIEVGEPEVYLWGAPVELDKTDRVKAIRDRLLNQLVLNAFEMSPGNMDTYLEAIQAFKPKCLYGYASSMALLAAHARERHTKLILPSLKAVCTTGEPLYPYQQALIEKVFGAPVANEFGSRDIGFTAHETPQGQVLLMSESIILEVLDPEGQPVGEGELGEAVMTGLCSEAQPFIRYRTGDIVRQSNDTCQRGRGLHVIGEVIGRSTDFIVRSDGAIMHALAVIYVLRAIEGVAEFKLIQHTVRDVEVLLVPSRSWQAEANPQIIKGLQARLGDEVRVQIRLLDQIPPEISGKHRYVVSHVPLPAALKIAANTNNVPQSRRETRKLA